MLLWVCSVTDQKDVKSGKDKKVRHQVHPSVSLFFRDDIKKKI